MQISNWIELNWTLFDSNHSNNDILHCCNTYIGKEKYIEIHIYLKEEKKGKKEENQENRNIMNNKKLSQLEKIRRINKRLQYII